MILYAAVGLHKRLLKLWHMQQQVTIFNRMIVVWNDQTSCSEFGVLIGHLVRNCLLVAFWLCFCLWFCLLVFCVSDMREHCAMLMGHREKCWAKLCPGSCPPDRPPARQEIRSIFGKISLIFDKNRPYFLTGNAGNQKATADCLDKNWKDKRALGWSCFCATSKGIVENNMAASLSFLLGVVFDS